MSVKTTLGLQARLYRNTGTYASPIWNEIKLVRDATLNLEKAEADTSSRESEFATVKGALRNCSIDFELVWDTGDANFDALLAAWTGDTAVELLCLDGAYNTTGSQGLRASFEVIKFTRAEQLSGALTAQVTVKPTRSDNPPTWFTAT
jgi:hypothetical protein